MGIGAGGRSHGAKADMNVTPLVDVVLVLLIIFLVTMPIQMRQITIEVPRKIDQEVEIDLKANENITLELRADGSILMRIGSSEETVSELALIDKLRVALKNKTGDKAVFVDFDVEVPWRNVVGLMDSVRGVGADKVALINKSALR